MSTSRLEEGELVMYRICFLLPMVFIAGCAATDAMLLGDDFMPISSLSVAVTEDGTNQFFFASHNSKYYESQGVNIRDIHMMQLSRTLAERHYCMDGYEITDTKVENEVSTYTGVCK